MPDERRHRQGGTSIEKVAPGAATVFLGLGSNLGDRQGNLLAAVQMLRQWASIEQISSLYETDPVGLEDQPRFLNCAVRIKTDLDPRGLLTALKEIERRVGRRPRGRWGPREIDLDILFYGDLILVEDDLIIPHPRAHERLFVLRPLSDIAPELIHPALNRRIDELRGEAEKTPVSYTHLTLPTN